MGNKKDYDHLTYRSAMEDLYKDRDLQTKVLYELLKRVTRIKENYKSVEFDLKNKQQKETLRQIELVIELSKELSRYMYA